IRDRNVTGVQTCALPIFKTIQVPATVQAVLAARIDRLPGDEKLLLQSSAVVGSDVPQALLEAIVAVPSDGVGRALASLQTAGFQIGRASCREREWAGVVA